MQDSNEGSKYIKKSDLTDNLIEEYFRENPCQNGSELTESTYNNIRRLFGFHIEDKQIHDM